MVIAKSRIDKQDKMQESRSRGYSQQTFKTFCRNRTIAMDPTRRNYSFESRYAKSMLNSRTGKIKKQRYRQKSGVVERTKKGNGRRDEKEASG